MDDPQVQSALLGFILPLAITLSVLLRRNTDLRQKLFVLFAGNVTLFYLFDFLYAWQSEPWMERVELLLAVLLPQTAIRFFRLFASGARGLGRLGRVATIFGLALLVAILWPGLMRPALGPAILLYVCGFTFVALLDLNVQARKAASRIDAARIRSFVIGGIFTVGFEALGRVTLAAGLDLPPLNLAVTVIFLYVTSQSLLSNRIFDLYEMLGRFAVLTAMGLALAVIYAALVAWVGRGYIVNAFLASLVILILFDPLRDVVERKISDFFFRERVLLGEEIDAIRRRLAHVISVEGMLRLLESELGASRRLTHAALYLVDTHGRGYDLRLAVGPPPELSRIEATTVRRYLVPAFPGPAVAVPHLVQRRDEHQRAGHTELAAGLSETLTLAAQLNADVLVLVRGEEQLLGILTLRDARLAEAFSPEEIALLAGLAEQIAVTVENSRLYQQSKDRDRLAALGEMAAGLAHEIRNPLGAIKAAAQYIEEVRPRPAELQPDSEDDFIKVIVEEVDRLNRVVSDFLTYARPTTGQPELLEVNEVIRRSLHVAQAGRRGATEIELVTELGDALPPVQVDRERLHQVFLNLSLNAFQALRETAGARLEVTSRARTVRVSGGAQVARWVEVRFADNGPGISVENLPKIFVPFFTTRSEGSGLGLAVCQRLVRDAGGDIEVRSREGEGAIFSVVLPAFDESRITGSLTAPPKA